MSWEVWIMKSRTSSYKSTWLKKNILRFMPFWALYILCLFLGLAMMSGSRDGFYFLMSLAGCARFMAVVNCGYALLTAQLLFGDLYSSRMCFGIHSLPLRREEIFGINVLSGLLFSLVPTALMTLCALPLALGSNVVKGGWVPLLWFAAANLQYLFFFGLAVLCVFTAGNRFSMAVVYCILNFLSLLVYLLVDSVYIPLLPGVINPFEWFQKLCPVGSIAVEPLLILQRDGESQPGVYTIQRESWIYLLTCAALGVVLLAAALQLYRRRALETAGEFIAVRALRPVFLVMFSICGAMALNLVTNMFMGYGQNHFLTGCFAAIGLVVAWFVGLMLLEKTTRVFRKRTFLGICILFLTVTASLLLTWLDVFGVAAWVPQPEQVESVFLIPQYDSYGIYWTERDNYKMESPEDVEAVTKIHYLATQEKVTSEEVRIYYDYYYDVGRYHDGGQDPDREPAEAVRFTVPLSLEYHMKDGTVRRRCYYIYADGVAGETMEGLLSRSRTVLDEPEILDIQGPAAWINVQGYSIPDEYMTQKDTRELLEAIRKDCEAGNMAQSQEFHTVPVWAEGDRYLPSIYISGVFHVGVWNPEFHMEVYSDSVHVMKWLQDRGLIARSIQEARA